jgi:hypothetical protein
MSLHALQYFMSSLVTFTDKSAVQVFKIVQNYGEPLEPYMSSRLLNRQIKYIMHKLHRDITTKVLEDLEKSMRSKTIDTWGTSFCTILLLCLCMEGLQTAAETLVAVDSQKVGEESKYSRSQSYDACIELDNYPFKQCTILFHMIYKTHKGGNGGRSQPGFNPFKNGCSGTGLDSATKSMVQSMNNLIFNSCKNP